MAELKLGDDWESTLQQLGNAQKEYEKQKQKKFNDRVLELVEDESLALSRPAASAMLNELFYTGKYAHTPLHVVFKTDKQYADWYFRRLRNIDKEPDARYVNYLRLCKLIDPNTNLRYLLRDA